MTVNRFSDSARYWRSPLAPGADMLTAEYYDYRGSHYVAEAGSVPVINPGELHTGARAVDAGWRYRVFYLPVEFVQSIASEVSGRAEPLPWFPAEIIRDGDLARRLALAHRALEAGGDPLAAET